MPMKVVGGRSSRRRCDKRLKALRPQRPQLRGRGPSLCLIRKATRTVQQARKAAILPRREKNEAEGDALMAETVRRLSRNSDSGRETPRAILEPSDMLHFPGRFPCDSMVFSALTRS